MVGRVFSLMVLAGAFSTALMLGAVGSAAPLAAPDNSIVLQPLVTTGLSNPLLVTHAGDGSGRLFIVERTGLIKVLVNGSVLPTPFLDMSSLITTSTLEQGLLGLVFHPQYETNGRFFIYYTAKPPPGAGRNTLVEYRVSPPGSNVANPTPVRTLLALDDDFPNHNGGHMAFSPVDNYLYVGIGDEGGIGDPKGNGQNLSVLFGKLLRLDVDLIPEGFPYGIPVSNPYGGNPAARREIWATGLRNPWRWSFDRGENNPGGRGTGDLYIGDVGQLSWEEIDVIPNGQGGLNFGWSMREGLHCHPNGTTGCPTAGLTDPIIEYGHPSVDPQNLGGCSVTGGYMYRGAANPSLRGLYIYADYCTGRIWKARPPIGPGQPWVVVEALNAGQLLSSFGEDEAGELYVTEFLNGTVYKIAAAPNQPVPPTAIPTPTLLPCAVRPNVNLQVTGVGATTLNALVTVTDSPPLTNNVIQSIAITKIENALVSAGNQTNRSTPFTATFPPGTKSTTITATRVAAGPMGVNLTVNDLCGQWPTFFGRGAGAL